MAETIEPVVASRRRAGVIEDYIEVTHAVSRISRMRPDGSYQKCHVENPQLNNSAPRCLRISVPRKGWTFNVIQEVQNFGLQVADVWQYENHKENDRIMLKVEKGDN